MGIAKVCNMVCGQCTSCCKVQGAQMGKCLRRCQACCAPPFLGKVRPGAAGNTTSSLKRHAWWLTPHTISRNNMSISVLPRCRRNCPERVLLGPARHDRRAVSDPRHGEQLRHRRAHAGCASRDVPRDAAPSNRLLRVFFDLVLRQDRVVLVVACDLDPTLQVQTLEDERVQIEGDMCPIVLGDLVECDPDLSFARGSSSAGRPIGRQVP